MKRNHIHLAQGVTGESVISGMYVFLLFSVLQLTRFVFLRHANILTDPHFHQSTKGTRRGHQVFLVR